MKRYCQVGKMKHNEQIKLNNFAAHYNVLRRRVLDANSKLENSLREFEDRSKDSSRLKRDIQAANSQLGSLRLSVENAKKNKETILSLIDEQEHVSRKLKWQITEAEELLRGKETVAERSVSARVVKKRSELGDLQRIIDTTVKDFSILKTSMDGAERRLSTDIDACKMEIIQWAASIEERKEELRSLKEIVDAKRKEVRMLTTREEGARMAIAEPDKQLRQREKRLVEKERNFQILTLRWKRFFEEHFPGQELKL